MTPLQLRVRQLRQEKGWSQEQLADAAGTNQATISNLELGKNRLLDLDVLDRVARALGVTAADLVVSGPRRKR